MNFYNESQRDIRQKPACSVTRFTDTTKNANDVALQEEILLGAIDMYGTQVSYYAYNYQLSSHDFLYGEEPTAPFVSAIEMKVLAELNSDALMLAKWGVINDADLTVLIPFKTFNEVTSSLPYKEPMKGDLIRLDELGSRRAGGGYDAMLSATSALSADGLVKCVDPDEYQYQYDKYMEELRENISEWIRYAPVYEITEKRDLAPTLGINRLAGAYVWYCKCRRFDYSYQPNAPIENGNDQVSDETFFGRLTGSENPPSQEKKYDQNVQDSSRQIFDYERAGGLDRTYGNY